MSLSLTVATRSSSFANPQMIHGRPRVHSSDPRIPLLRAKAAKYPGIHTWMRFAHYAPLHVMPVTSLAVVREVFRRRFAMLHQAR